MKGHLWTLAPHLADAVFPPRNFGQPWTATVPDARFGAVRITGLFDHNRDSDAVIVLVHGMGGHAERSYMVRAAQIARGMGLSSLRLTLRGCDRGGEDMYHAGLVEDLQTAIASPELAGFARIYTLGFSLGGHMVMRYTLSPAERVRGAAAICSPLDLSEACNFMDEPRQVVYRTHLLQGLRETGRSVEARRGIQLAPKPLAKIRRIREWDDLVTAPRFGFFGVDEYYQHMSVAPHVHKFAVPTLMVFAEQDPLLSSRILRAGINETNDITEVRFVHGGHVRFPRHTGAIHGALRWLLRH